MAIGTWATYRFPRPGRWHLRIDALTDFQKITLEDDFEVPAPLKTPEGFSSVPRLVARSRLIRARDVAK